MKRTFLSSVCSLTAVIFLSGLSELPVDAQDEKAPAGGLEIAEISGELETLSNNPLGLKVKAEDGELYTAVLARQSTMTYTNSAELAFLKPGLYVRFIAPFVPQTLTPQTPVLEIEVFRQAKQRRMTRDQLLSQTPGIHPVLEKKNNDKGKTPAAPTGTKNFQVVGQVRAIQANMLQVVAGKYPVTLQLDPAAKVTVSSGDTFFCMPGDKVEVSGLRNPSQATMIQAETVTITGSRPLGSVAEDDKNKRPTRRSRLNRNKR